MASTEIAAEVTVREVGRMRLVEQSFSAGSGWVARC